MHARWSNELCPGSDSSPSFLYRAALWKVTHGQYVRWLRHALASSHQCCRDYHIHHRVGWPTIIIIKRWWAGGWRAGGRIWSISPAPVGQRARTKHQLHTQQSLSAAQFGIPASASLFICISIYVYASPVLMTPARRPAGRPASSIFISCDSFVQTPVVVRGGCMGIRQFIFTIFNMEFR